MTEQSLDDIMSGRDLPAPETATAPAVADAPAPDGHARDDKGRFAVKQPEAAPSPTTEAPTPAAPTGHVPIQALDAERGKRKDIEERYDREMKELRDQIARLSQPQKPAEPAPAPPSMFEDPEAYMQHQLSPVQSEVQQVRNMLMKLEATQTHGADAIQAAYEAAKLIENTPEGKALEAQVMSGGNPFANLVKWHKSQSLLSEIGTDPEAYKKRIIDEYLAQNALTQQPSPTQQPATAPMPTAFANTPNGGPRGGPEYGGPRPLSEIKPGL